MQHNKIIQKNRNTFEQVHEQHIFNDAGHQNNRKLYNQYIQIDIGKNLGQGTFGKVKLGIHTLTTEKVAIKILQKSKISDIADVERVTREINILKQVHHPNIIQLYEIIETPKQLFLVMEYVSEGELFDQIVKRKRLKQNEACQYFQQIIASVQYLHELGIVHRDLKPENLLIDYNRRIKLVDFGLSNTYKQKQVLKTACGSPCYAAPEMIAGKKYEGLIADIWSCGVILYAMVCGYLPFEDPNTSALYKKIISGQFTIPKFVSASAKQLIRGILTTDPQRRYTLKQIKEHQWFKQIQNNQFYNFDRPPMGIKISQHLMPVDDKIVEDLGEYQQLRMNTQQIKKMIANNRHNHTVTTYYLLLKKNLKIGLNSNCDICSSTFNKNLLIQRSNQNVAKEIANARTQLASTNTSFTANSKTITKYEQAKQRYSLSQQNRNKTIDEIDLTRNTITTSNGFRIGSRAVNRIHMRDFSQDNGTNKNNYIIKRKEDSVQLKLDLDNLPIVDQIYKVSQKKRRLNINSHRINNNGTNLKKEQLLTDLYGVEDTFRTTGYMPGSKNGFRNSINAGGRVPISFRTSLDRYQPQSNGRVQRQGRDDRYQSLQIAENEQQNTFSKDRQKEMMNKTFMGRIPKSSIPKWSDQSERIRSILNKTITGHGTRKKKIQLSSFN